MIARAYACRGRNESASYACVLLFLLGLIWIGQSTDKLALFNNQIRDTHMFEMLVSAIIFLVSLTFRNQRSKSKLQVKKVEERRDHEARTEKGQMEQTQLINLSRQKV